MFFLRFRRVNIEQFRPEGSVPGIILGARRLGKTPVRLSPVPLSTWDKNEAAAKYSFLSEGRQIFASKYLQFLPSEPELRLEIEKERKAIEAGSAEQGKAADE
jgi:hypothetical protein